MKNISKTTTTIIAVTTVLFVIGFGFSEADAARCSDPHCYAIGKTFTNYEGAKFTTDVTNMVPEDNCEDHPTVTVWVIFPNDDWIENGFTSGELADSCYSTEKSYYAYENTFGYYEYNAGSVTVSSTYTFSIDDINQDNSWLVKRGTSQLANLATAYSYADEIHSGAEGDVTNPGTDFIPETEITDFKVYDDTDSAWELLPSSPQYSTADNTEDYYFDRCSTNGQSNFNVGTDSGVSC